MFGAVKRPVRSWRLFGAVELFGQRRVQNTVDERRFTRPRRPGDAGKCAERQFDADILQVVLGRADDLDAFAAAAPTFGRNLDLSVAAQVGRRQRYGVVHEHVGRAFSDDLAAVNPGPWP